MSEVAEAPVRTEAGAGALLRQAREATGLHVAALAVSLKVPVRKLEALEEDRYQDIGDAVFIRALASSVCRTLKIDPQPVLERLPQTSAPRLVRDSDGINAPFRAPGDGPAPRWIDTVRQPVPATVLALLVGAVIVYFLPVMHLDETAAAPAASRSPSAISASPAAAPAPAVFISAPIANEAAPAASATASSAAQPAVAAPAPAPRVAAPSGVQPGAPITVAAAPAAVTPAAPASAAPTANGIVVIRTRGASWVEVVDAKGNVAVRKIMEPGETLGASGATPLAVTVGKADVTEIEVRGRKFDMRPVSKDNVARFEVK